jgi:plastocyanin
MSMIFDRREFALFLTGIGLSVAGPALAQAKTVEVSMTQSPKALFDPPTVKISVGDKVHWTNPGVITHTVTFDPAQATTASDVALPAGVQSFGSDDLEQDGTYEHTFTAKGTYKYVCKYHEAMGMVGTVIVS